MCVCLYVWVCVFARVCVHLCMCASMLSCMTAAERPWLLTSQASCAMHARMCVCAHVCYGFAVCVCQDLAHICVYVYLRRYRAGTAARDTMEEPVNVIALVGLRSVNVLGPECRVRQAFGLEKLFHSPLAGCFDSHVLSHWLRHRRLVHACCEIFRRTCSRL